MMRGLSSRSSSSRRHRSPGAGLPPRMRGRPTAAPSARSARVSSLACPPWGLRRRAAAAAEQTMLCFPESLISRGQTRPARPHCRRPHARPRPRLQPHEMRAPALRSPQSVLWASLAHALRRVLPLLLLRRQQQPLLQLLQPQRQLRQQRTTGRKESPAASSMSGPPPMPPSSRSGLRRPSLIVHGSRGRCGLVPVAVAVARFLARTQLLPSLQPFWEIFSRSPGGVPSASRCGLRVPHTAHGCWRQACSRLWGQCGRGGMQ
mmetsp:Transcript_11725/g.31841  ORF Transcript_11725/g.31841 Transcript_11725/m.31841 type:complete len:262 (-) Transcript_11725:1107-1892(-)